MLALLGAPTLHGQLVVWYYGSNPTAPAPADSALAVDWKDTFVNPYSANTSYGALTTHIVQQRRTVPPLQAHALFSFGGLLGSGPGQLSPDTPITSATLYLYVDSVSGSQTFNIRGLSPADAGWVQNEATYNSSAAGSSWSGGNLSASLTGTVYGSSFNPGGTGWFPIDVTSSLQAYQHGDISGIALLASDTPVSGIRNFVFQSNEGLHGPGLLVTTVPEPALWPTIALVVAGAAGIARRRSSRHPVRA